MINISIGKNVIEVTGHAGYAPAGQDIVCASVSTLFYTLAQNVRILECENKLIKSDIVLQEGYSRIKAEALEKYENEVNLLFEYIKIGLQLLEHSYSSFVQINNIEQEDIPS